MPILDSVYELEVLNLVLLLLLAALIVALFVWLVAQTKQRSTQFGDRLGRVEKAQGRIVDEVINLRDVYPYAETALDPWDAEDGGR